MAKCRELLGAESLLAHTRMAENHLNSVEVVPSQLDSVSAEYREKYDAYFLKK